MKQAIMSLLALLALQLAANPLTRSVVFPADWQGAKLAIVKKLPQAIIVKLAGNPQEFTAAGRIVVDTPRGVRVVMMTPRWNRPKPYGILRETTVDGNRAILPYPLAWFRALTPDFGWGAGHYVFLEADGTAAPKPGKLTVTIEHAGTVLKRHVVELEVLPELVPPAQPLKAFQVGIAAMTSTCIDDTGADVFLRSAAYWESLAKRPYIRIGWPSVTAPPKNLEHLGEHFTVILGCHACRDSTLKCGGANFEDLGFSVHGKVTRPGVPPMLDKDGKPMPGSICPQYLLDDPGNLFHGQYIPRIIQFYQNLYKGRLAGLHLDFEPFVENGTCDDCMKAFAKFAGLDAVPTRDDIVSGKPLHVKWREFKTDQHRRVLEKIIGAIDAAYPGMPFHFCGSTPMPKAKAIYQWDAVWTEGLETRIACFEPMNYTVGLPYYNAIANQLQAIGGKSKILSYTDPSEESERFFMRYTPQTQQQNFLATIAQGAHGFVLYPSDALDGRHFQLLNDTVRAVQTVEDFYQTKNRPDALKWHAENVLNYTIRDLDGSEKTVAEPDFSQVVRVHLHELGGEYVVTLLNYSPLHDAILNLAIPGYKGKGTVADILHNQALADVAPAQVATGFLACVPRNGAVILKIGRNAPAAAAPSQATLAETARLATNGGKTTSVFTRQTRDDRAAEWILKDGKIYFRLDFGKQWLLIDAADNGTVKYWKNGEKHPATNPETVFGNVFFYSQDQTRRPFTLVSCDLSKDASATFTHTIPPDMGFGAENPLAGLVITKRIALLAPQTEAGTIRMDTTFTNSAKVPVTFGFRIQNIPAKAGAKDAPLDARFANGSVPGEVALKKGVAIPWANAANAPESPDDLTVTVNSRWYAYTLEHPQAVGMYSWKNSAITTVEPLFPEVTLQPGESTTFTTTAAFKLRP